MIPIKPKDAIWTDEQWQAIHDCGHNIIVSAGAGSGKTAVLSERVITNLKKGMHINEMLMLTFTKAAASEMKERIRKKIKKDKSLVGELDLIDAAYITTFDSFALSVVKKYHYLLNISPNISIIDSAMIMMKKREILENLFEDYYEKGNSKFLKLIGDFCIKDDKEIFDAILKIYSKLEMLPDKIGYLKSYLDIYFDEKKINTDVLAYEKLILNKIKEINAEVSELTHYVDGDYIEKLEEALGGLLNSKDYDEIVKNLNIRMPNLPRGSEECAKEKKDNIKELIDSIKGLCVYIDSNDMKDTINICKDYVSVLIDIFISFDKKVMEYKNSMDVYEFHDIAIMAIKVLKENEEVRNEMKYFFKEIMIDEYQDTNDLQETFIGMIENDNVYMVGDIKQSIYRFRNANPDIFKNKYDNYSSNNGGAKIDLNKNFRSRKEVLDNINLIFNKIMDNDIGGADYIVSHQMIFGNNSYIEKGSTNQNYNFEIYSYDYEKGCEYAKDEVECFIIARDIIDKVNNHYKIFDKDDGILRDAKYSDFVILMDRTTNFDLYKKVFEYLGIPLAILKDERMNEDQDIIVISNLLQFIIKVRDGSFDKEFQYLFMSILRSFLYQYDDERIFEYFVNGNFKDCELYSTAKEIAYDISKKSSYDILLEIINKFDYYEKIIFIGNINSSMTKLEHILNSASNLGDLGYDVIQFSMYLKNIVKDNYDMKYLIHLGDSDSVKIMTIHKSKGLEYPICYYSGLYKSFNILDLKEKFTYDKEYGIIVPFFKEGIGQTIYKELLRDRYIREEISEKIRLYYVALTRAKEKMIVVMPSGDEPASNNSGIVNNSIRSKYRSLADIMNSVLNITRSYVNNIDLKSLNLTKDYNLITSKNFRDNIPKSNIDIDVCEIKIANNYVSSKHFSKHTNDLIDKKTRDNMDFGLYIHEILEYMDFKNPDYSFIKDNYSKERVKKFLNQELLKNIKEAKIYHEYEFVYDKDSIRYHGIIDLMLEYDNHIDIVDYKLKNIEDFHYLDQLNGYKEYISLLTSKEVNIYLYSILDDKMKKIN